MTLTQAVPTMRGLVRIWRTLAGKIGWNQTFIQQKPVDSAGQPLPWYTYPAIEFLRSLDLSKARVFEYGCGYSSVFWAKQAASVVAVENDMGWAEAVKKFGVPNLEVHAIQDLDEYIQTPLKVGGTFDVVIVDGRRRRDCAAVALQVVAENGMIIFDNADWYRDSCADLRKAGWFEVDFSGFGPINPYVWTTAVFLKANMQFPNRQVIDPMGGIPQQEEPGA